MKTKSKHHLPGLIISGNINAPQKYLSATTRIKCRLVAQNEVTFETGVNKDGFYAFQIPEERISSIIGHALEINAVSREGKIISGTKTVSIVQHRNIKCDLDLLENPVREILHEASPGKHSDCGCGNGEVNTVIQAGYIKEQSTWNMLSVNENRLNALGYFLSQEQDAQLLVPGAFNHALQNMEKATHAATQILAGETSAAHAFKAILSGVKLEKPQAKTKVKMKKPMKDLGQKSKPKPREEYLFNTDHVMSILMAGFALDLSEGRNKAHWLLLSSTFMHTMALPAERYFMAKTMKQCGLIDPPDQEFYPDQAPGREPLLGRGDRPGFSRPSLPCDDGFMPRDPGDFLDDRFWLECNDILFAELEQVIESAGRRGPDTGKIGLIKPKLLCYNYTNNIQIDIIPARGQTFDLSAAFEVIFANGRSHDRDDQVSLSVISAASNLISVALPAGLHSGFIYFKWATGHAITGTAKACAKLSRFTSPLLRNNIRFHGHFPIKTEFNQVEIVQKPVIRQFSGNGKQVSVLAEGCTNVLVSVATDFGRSEFSNADNLSLDRIRLIYSALVNVNGNVTERIFRNTPSHNDSFFLTDPFTRTIKVKAETIVNERVCGYDEKELRIERFQALHLSSDIAEIRSGQSGNLTVKRSCALGDPVKIFLFSSDPGSLSLPHTVTIPANQDEVSVQFNASGTLCKEVIISCRADGYVSTLEDSELQIFVFSNPVITTVSQNTVDACTPFNLTINGSCFAPGSSVALRGNIGPRINLDVNSVSANRIVCSSPGINPGTYALNVQSRGLLSNSFTFQVNVTAPVINNFTVFPRNVPPCATTPVALNWDVRGAAAIRINKNGDELESFLFNSCRANADDFLDLINDRTEYELVVTGTQGTVVRRSLTVEVTGNFASRVTIENNSRDTIVFWLHQPFPNSIPGKFVRLASGATGSIDISDRDCLLYSQLIAVSVTLAANVNEDPEDEQTARTANYTIAFPDAMFVSRATARTSTFEFDDDLGFTLTD